MTCFSDSMAGFSDCMTGFSDSMTGIRSMRFTILVSIHIRFPLFLPLVLSFQSPSFLRRDHLFSSHAHTTPGSTVFNFAYLFLTVAALTVQHVYILRSFVIRCTHCTPCPVAKSFSRGLCFPRLLSPFLLIFYSSSV